MMFLGTLSFLFSTPGWEPSLGGFPALSALPGQSQLKDVVLVGAALWSLGEAWAESANRISQSFLKRSFGSHRTNGALGYLMKAEAAQHVCLPFGECPEGKIFVRPRFADQLIFKSIRSPGRWFRRPSRPAIRPGVGSA
jgi:hypothetical protein